MGAGEDTFLSDGTLQDTTVKNGDGTDTFNIVNRGHNAQYELNGVQGDDIFEVIDGSTREEYRVVQRYAGNGKETICKLETAKDIVSFEQLKKPGFHIEPDKRNKEPGNTT